MDQYEDKVSIGEIYVPPPGNAKTAASYLASGKNGIHLAFDFSMIFTIWDAQAYFNCIRRWYDCIPEEGWPCHVMSNHDLLRSIDRIPWRTKREQTAKVAAMLLLTLRGTPVIYYGEEIGGSMSPSRPEFHWPEKGDFPARLPVWKIHCLNPQVDRGIQLFQ